MSTLKFSIVIVCEAKALAWLYYFFYEIEKGFEPLLKDLQSLTLTGLCYSIKVLKIYIFGIEGFEPANVRTKNECLAFWLYSKNYIRS